MKLPRGGPAPALAILAVALCAAFPAPSEPTASASLAGSVLSADRTGLAGARVTLVHASTGTKVRVTSAERGVYRADGLAPGAWRLTAELPGFLTRELDAVALRAGEKLALDVTLAVATVRERVTVIGETPSDSLEASAIRESTARDVGEALAALPGVVKLRKGGIANDVVVRGYQTKDLNVLIDGQRLYGACPNHMDPPSFHVDFAEVDRVEVGKGPFDVKNQGSLGGVVNIVTKKPEPGLHAVPTLGAGSFGYVNPSVTASWGGERLSVLGGYSFRQGKAYETGDGQRFTELANYRADAVDSEAFRAGTAWGKAVFSPAEGHAIQASYTRQDADEVFYPYLLMDAVYDDSNRFNLSYEAAELSSLVSGLKVQGYYTDVEHWMTDERRTSSVAAPRGWSMGTMATTRAVGGKAEATLSSVTVGVEAFERSWDATTQMAGMGYAAQASVPDATTTSAGVYAELKRPLGKAVSLTAGARLERTRTAADPALANTDLYFAYNGTRETEATDVLPSGSVRLAWRIAEGLQATAGVGHTVRVPEPNERYFALRRAGSDWVGDPSLAPSRNTGVDLGLGWRRPGATLSVSAFWNGVADYVAVHDQPKANAVPGVMNPKARSYANVDATLLGAELSGVLAVTDRVFLSASGSYVRGTQDGNPAKGILPGDLAEMPPLSARASIRYDAGTVWAEVEGAFAAAQDEVDASLREEPTPGWGIANLKAGLNLGSLSVSAGVGNLFDRTYAEHLSYQRDPFRSGVKVPEPGRSFFATASYRF